MGLQHIYKSSNLLNEVSSILAGIMPEKINSDRGRRGMDLWKILVLGTLKLNCKWDYDKVHDIVNNHKTVRLMIGHDTDDFRQYGLQTIKDNIKLLKPVILKKINQLVIKSGHELLNKQNEVLKGKCDSFVLETDVHYPTDINLLFDAIRCILKILAKSFDKVGITEWRQYSHNLRKVKKLFNIARRLHRSNSKNDKKIALREALIIKAHEQYLEMVETFIKRAKRAILAVREMGLDVNVMTAQLVLVDNYIVHAERQIDQVRRRIVNGETIPHSEKVFSIFEEHTEWIKKGKAGITQELGIRVCILSDQFGFILHHHVMENQIDQQIAVKMIEDTRNKFKNLKICSFDKGFYTPENKIELQKHLTKVILPKKGKLSKKDKQEEHSEEFIEARHKHSAVESSINALENHGLDRCLDHGIYGFKRYVALAVLARNIQILGSIIQNKKKKSIARLEKLKKAA